MKVSGKAFTFQFCNLVWFCVLATPKTVSLAAKKGKTPVKQETAAVQGGLLVGGPPG